MVFARVFPCDLAGDFLCTSRCFKLDNSVDVFYGEKTTITKVPDTVGLYTMTVEKGTMHETEHCAAFEQTLTCATTNLTNDRVAVDDDIPYPLINELVFDSKCNSFVKLVRKFDVRTVCNIECSREGKSMKSRIKDVRFDEEFICAGFCFHANQTIQRILDEKNTIAPVAGFNSQFTKVEINSNGFHEIEHCGVFPDFSNICLTTNRSDEDAPEVFEKTVFNGMNTYAKYVRSLTEDKLFVCGAECSLPENTRNIRRRPECSISGIFNCSGVCLDSDGSIVNSGGTTTVQEVMEGLFYNVTVAVGSGAKQVVICVLDQSGLTPALRCVMSEKSNVEGRVAAFEEIIYDSSCSSITKVLRDLRARNHAAVCKFSCNRL